MWRRLGFVLPFLFLATASSSTIPLCSFKLLHEPDCQELAGRMKSEGYSLREKLQAQVHDSASMSAYGRGAPHLVRLAQWNRQHRRRPLPPPTTTIWHRPE
uniref:Secreted protein n=1 Tax=Macrostomum lignano TaxID=282301 RepID=A0A1I8FNX4_9PLAT